MSDSVPSNDDLMDAMMVTLIVQLTPIATVQGVSAGQLTVLNNDRSYWRYALDNMAVARTYSEGFTAWKNELRDGTGPASPPPEPPVLFPTLPPTAVDRGIEKRLRDLIAQIKKNPNYTKAIGEVLGIENGDDEFDPTTGKPVLTLTLAAGNHVMVGWKKKKFQGVRIEMEAEDGSGWHLLTIDTQPDYLDTTPGPAAGTSQLRRYRAAYMLNDAMVGVWSDIAEIAVPGV